MYREMGISPKVLALGTEIEKKLKDMIILALESIL